MGVKKPPSLGLKYWTISQSRRCSLPQPGLGWLMQWGNLVVPGPGEVHRGVRGERWEDQATAGELLWLHLQPSPGPKARAIAADCLWPGVELSLKLVPGQGRAAATVCPLPQGGVQATIQSKWGQVAGGTSHQGVGSGKRQALWVTGSKGSRCWGTGIRGGKWWGSGFHAGVVTGMNLRQPPPNN